MFYNTEVLSKKGKLARVWLAAHYDKKLTKPQVLHTNIVKAIDAIIGEDQVPMALRLLGYLLLGIAKLYWKKTDYLLKDCNDAIVHIKLAFRPGVTEKTKKKNVASARAITLTDIQIDLDVTIPLEAIEMDISNINEDLEEIQAYDTVNIASYGDITLAEQPMIEPLPDETDLSVEHPRDSPQFIDFPPQIEEPFQLPEDLHMEDIEPVDTTIVSLEPPEVDLPDEVPQRIPRGEREIKVRSDRRNTTLSAEVMRNNIADTSPIEREIERAPTTRNEMERLITQRSDVEQTFTTSCVNAPAGLAQELHDLFIDALNITNPFALEVVPPETPVGEQEPDQEPEQEPFVFTDPMEEPPVELPESPFDYPSVEHPRISVAPEPEFSIYEPEPPTQSTTEESAELYELPHQSYSRRTSEMRKVLAQSFADTDRLRFEDLVKIKKRSVAAQRFFELLVLKSKNYIDLQQEEPYSDIYITKTELFDAK